MNVDFVNLKRNLDDNYKGCCQSILEPKISDFLFNNCDYVNGPQVKEFEDQLLQYSLYFKYYLFLTYYLYSIKNI